MIAHPQSISALPDFEAHTNCAWLFDLVSHSWEVVYLVEAVGWVVSFVLALEPPCQSPVVPNALPPRISQPLRPRSDQKFMDLRTRACKLRDANRADSENQRDATGRPPIKIPSLLLLANAIMREQKIDANDCIGKSALKS